jgi:5-methylcytosine-specific restriction enzyme A
MPSAPKRICSMHRLIYESGTKCPKCEANKAPRPRKEADPFYSSSAWRKLRAVKLAADPLCQCEDCERLGRVLAADTVDHRLERSEHPHLELDYENLVSMNRSCHNRKTARERARRKGGGGMVRFRDEVPSHRFGSRGHFSPKNEGLDQN